MAVSEDLINFDLIETHKENIQSLPGGRSARQLVAILSPMPTTTSTGVSSPTLDETKTLNDAIRQEYELELQSIADADDPLDIYDRYVKWTLNAYPSAQATPQSQLLPLLERATKSFLTSSLYKNDPRYLKLWLHYIRLFSDAPRETFAFLARHNIGDGLALFYEEFATWLESVGRWTQAEEVYKLGIEREAKPAERLMRKYNQFQKRLEARPPTDNEPSSPALTTVRPVLAAKIDPFAPVPRPDEQVPRPSSGAGAASRSGKPKMAIFSDTEIAAPPPPSGAADGWDSIGSIRERKKENTVEARPWAGETLKAGKKVGVVPKMEIFKDPNRRSNEHKQSSTPSSTADMVNPKTGRAERVFVDIEVVWPNQGEEFSFEELRAVSRGWAARQWRKKPSSPLRSISHNVQKSPPRPLPATEHLDAEDVTSSLSKLDISEAQSQEIAQLEDMRPPKQKKVKVREIKQEAQTVKTRLESPTGPKLKRKVSAEPTMTFHSKVATNEIYDLWNRPKISEGQDDTQSGDDTDFADDDNSTAGESTGTGRISGTTSEYGEETQASLHGPSQENTSSQPDSVSPWSEFTASKHMPKMRNKARQTGSEDLTENIDSSQNQTQTGGLDTQAIAMIANQDLGDLNTKVIAAMAGDFEDEIGEAMKDELKTPISPHRPEVIEIPNVPRYIPLPPEDYDPTPVRPFRDPELAAQNRLPFMTPIVEKTESSLAPSTVFTEKHYFTSKTPSRATGGDIRYESPSKLPVANILLRSPEKESLSPSKRKLQEHNATSDTDLFAASPQKKKALMLPPSPKKHTLIERIPFPESKPEKPAPARETSNLPVQLVKPQSPIIKEVQCNPCDASIRLQILESISPPLSARHGYHDRSSETFNHYPLLRKHAEKVSKVKASPKKDKVLTNALPPILKFEGTNRVYAVKRLLGKGAFAPVYLVDSYDPDSSSDATRTEFDRPSPPVSSSSRLPLEAIKTDSPPLNSTWEFHILTLLQERLPPTSRTLASLVRAHECHVFADEAYLILSYHVQGTLLDLVNAQRANHVRSGKSVDGLEEPLAMFFATELLRTVESLHAIGIIHGDVKVDNCLVRLDPTTPLDTTYTPSKDASWSTKGLLLIDFGRAIDTHAFLPGATFIADWAATQADCAEIREARAWTHHIDYHGVAGTLHNLLFGRFIETLPVAGSAVLELHQQKEYRLREPFKRYWQGALWSEVFATLLNPGLVKDRETMPIQTNLARIRSLLEAYLETEGERRDLRGAIRRAERLVAKRK